MQIYTEKVKKLFFEKDGSFYLFLSYARKEKKKKK